MEESDLRVTTDSKWLSFVLEQILTNAAKYTPQGSVRIYTQNNTLIVEDTGIGIRAEELPVFSSADSRASTDAAILIPPDLRPFICAVKSAKIWGHKISITLRVGQARKCAFF